MESDEKKVVKVGSRLSKYIGSKASREKKLQAAALRAEFTLVDTLIMLCYLGRDPDKEISTLARTNLIPAARAWSNREDRPDLPAPIHEIVMKVIETVGPGEKESELVEEGESVEGNIGLLGLGEIIQSIDHNNRTVHITLRHNGDQATVFTHEGKVVGAVAGEVDGLEALYSAFGWGDATFMYVHSPVGEFKNRIEVNTLNLVMDALERAPEHDPFDSELSRNWKVEGHLRIMNVFEIAEIFEMNSRQAVCRLQRPEGEEGTLYFNNGRIINAQLGQMTGMDAACHLLAWPSARFSISRGGEDVTEVIHIGMQNLIIEAMRLLDEGVTVTDKIASELELINELFEGQDVFTLPVLDKVRLVFGEDTKTRESLEVDANPIVRKAIKVKISKTIHKYLSPATEPEVRLKAARGRVPLSTTEKLVLLSYLSHDESQEIRDQAKATLDSLDRVTYHKGLGSDLHPSVMDYLVRETIRDESLIRVACSSEGIMPETAQYVMEHWKSKEILGALADNSKLLESSSTVTGRLYQLVLQDARLKVKIENFERSLLEGYGDVKVEGPLSFCGLSGLINAALHGARSGTIVLEGEKTEGNVFFKKGKIVGAVCGSLEGRPAIEEMLRWDDLKFRYVLRTHFHVENIDPATTEDVLSSKSAMPFHDEESRAGLRLVTGNPEAMDIFEVLSALEGVPVQVMIAVKCEEGSGEIYRDRSRVLHVHVEGKEGPEKAMAAMLAWSGARFMVRYAPEEIPVKVDKKLGDFFTECLLEVPNEMKQVSRPGELPQWELSEFEYHSLYKQILEMGVADKIKLAFMGNKEARELLVRDANRMVSVAVVKSPKIQESEIEAISKNRSVSDDVLRQIGATKEWMKSYSVKLNLAGNSKTPVPLALKLLPHIREMDLRKLGKSKDVSNVIATQARRLAEARSGH